MARPRMRLCASTGTGAISTAPSAFPPKKIDRFLWALKAYSFIFGDSQVYNRLLINIHAYHQDPITVENAINKCSFLCKVARHRNRSIPTSILLRDALSRTPRDQSATQEHQET